MTAPTPGPWRVGGPSREHDVEGRDAGGVWVLRARAWGGTPEEIRANARLIAQTPKMVVALRAVLINLELAAKEGRDLGPYGRLAAEAARAAIARAEGPDTDAAGGGDAGDKGSAVTPPPPGTAPAAGRKARGRRGVGP